MEPTESLILVAELGVALVAAAGIVTAIGGRDRDYSPVDRLRVSSLILTAALPLAAALLGLTLLAAEVRAALSWSLVSFAQAALIITVTVSSVRESIEIRQRPEGVRRSWAGGVGVHLALGASVLLLLLYNAFVLSAFWPILVACTYQLLSAVWLVLDLVLESE